MILHGRRRMWLYALTGMMLMIATTGFARMSYGVLMPYLQAGLRLSHAQAGLLGTCISLGYLLIVIAAGMFASRWGQKRVITAGASIVTFSLFGFSFVPAFGWAIPIAILAGVGSAMTFVPLTSYMITAFPQRRGLIMGLLLSGPGLAMFISGSIVPIQEAWFHHFSWRDSWLFFAMFSMIAALSAVLVLKESKSSAVSKSAVRDQASRGPGGKATYRNKEVLKIALLYFCVGVAYLIPILFQTGYMLHAGIPSKLAGLAFAVAGFFGIMSGPILGGFSDWLGRQAVVIMAMCMAVLGTLLPVLWPGAVMFLLSAALLGSTGGLIALIQAAVSEQVDANELPVAVGLITFFFATGQIIGPGLAGWIIEAGDRFSNAYLLSSALYVIGLGICIRVKFVKRPSRTPAGISKNRDIT